MTQADAMAIRQARHARVRTIRRRVMTATAALFVAVWLLIAVTLVTGHDPALAQQSSSQSSSSSAAGSSSSGDGVSSTSSGSGSDGYSSSSGGYSSGSGSGSGGYSTAPTPLTTSQS